MNLPKSGFKSTTKSVQEKPSIFGRKGDTAHIMSCRKVGCLRCSA